MKLIGLSGFAQSGKDTVGKIICDQYGFTRVSFADKLREVALAIDPFVEMEVGWGPWHRLSDVVADRGWEGAKNGSTDVRRLLQRLGTDAGRNILGEDIWVDAAMKDLDRDNYYVFTDVRFPNEHKAITDSGGQTWLIRRDGTGPINSHPSEIALEGFEFDHAIFNNGSIGDLEESIRKILRAGPLARHWSAVAREDARR